MFVEKKNPPALLPKSSVGAVCFGGLSLRREHTCRSYGACGGIFPGFPVLQTCHSYGVYEEYFIVVIAQVEKYQKNYLTIKYFIL